VTADIAGIGLVVVLEDFIEGRNVLARGFIGYDVPVEIDFLYALQFQPVGDYAPDITVVDDVLDLFRL
jgi:hypothetical protein